MQVWDVSLTIRFSKINDQNKGVNYKLFFEEANKYMSKTTEKIKDKMISPAVVPVDIEDVEDVYNKDILNNVNNNVELNQLNT
jgi:uncharacterized protein YfcZ (UPF0381/DUF406 family)